MTQSPSSPLLQHPAFSGISQSAANRLAQATRQLRFELGQPLCDADTIPARVLVILQGQARFVSRRNGLLTTVGKFGPGSVIGAASLMTGAPCENVIASDEVIACAIADELWNDFYTSEDSFRDWCDGQIWPQELLGLLEVLDQTSAETDQSPLEELGDALQSVEKCAPTASAVGTALANGRLVYVTSSWGDAQLGQRIESESDLPSSDRFALRLVSMPQSKAADEEHLPSESIVEAVVENAELLPPISRYSPERNVVDSLSILSADGPIPETLACFQMLTQLMKLPFRRDSIEKVLQDNIRRGLKAQPPALWSARCESWPSRDGSQSPSCVWDEAAGAIDASMEGWLCLGGGEQRARTQAGVSKARDGCSCP
jgi:ATP-binding cassette subfamily B protein